MSWHSRPLSSSPGALLGTGRGLKVSQSLLFSRLDNPSSSSLAPEGFQPSDQLRGLLWICSRTSTSLWRPQSCRWGLPRAEEKGKIQVSPMAVGWLCCPSAWRGECTECVCDCDTSCPSQGNFSSTAPHTELRDNLAGKTAGKTTAILELPPQSNPVHYMDGGRVLSTLPAAPIPPPSNNTSRTFVRIYLVIVNFTYINLKAL